MHLIPLWPHDLWAWQGHILFGFCLISFFSFLQLLPARNFIPQMNIIVVVEHKNTPFVVFNHFENKSSYIFLENFL